MTQTITRSWMLQVALFALIYFIVGKLALLLAIEPGYATPIWPPTGLGIAALLIFGTNRGLGCLLGALAINMTTTGSLGFATSLGLAFGSLFGILGAVFFVRRFLQYPKSFYLEKDILLFLFICGPLTGFISSTWCVSLLYYVGRVHPESFFLNWLHWFIGDATGAIIFSPLALVFSSKSRRYWMGSITKVLAPLAICMLLVFFALQYINKVENKQLKEDFQRQAELSFDLLEKDLHSFQALLGTLQSFFDNSANVSRDEFKNFSYHLLTRSSGIEALLWIPLISESTYTFKVLYAEPLDQNSHLVGTDLGRHLEYKNLMLKTLRSKKITGTSPLTIEEDEKVSLALAVAHPLGLLVEVINPKKILSALMAYNDDGSYRMRVQDVTLPQRPLEIISSWKNGKDEPFFKGSLRWVKILPVGDRLWQFEIEQDPSLKPSSMMNTVVVLFISLIFAYLTCALLLTTANRIITTQALVEQKTEHLRDLNMQLERASKTKSEFLANMSHEIRTPLNVIIGMADLLEEAPLRDHQRHYLEISRKAGDNLLNIINDILDISKIESGLITLEKCALDLPEVVTEVYEMFLPKATEKGVDLKLHINDEVKNIYLGDPTRTRQILSNLVSNALKFTEKGFIEIRVSAFADDTVPGNILFEVQDSGIGIAPDVLSILFKPFTQADSTITRKFGGTGLGLSISKRLTEMMNGHISLDSEVGVGSTFRFTLTLPYVRPAHQKVQVKKSDPSAPKLALRILIVDDADDNRMLLRAYLQGTPHHIMEADNGMEALDIYRRQEFDIILMDMQMPGMDGFTTVRKLREFEAQNRRKPAHIWALTAYALKNEIQRSLDAGCERHLTKPIRKQALLAEINSYNQTRH
ncbi:hypothetical protein AZI86_01515 [Bdellovibrio bacteriovorus]|uniref:Sensory/regulatory protein RpfC n=1 Tax=Bdellovibrio bacteriovorus TaxID=959 RepID=A0A150WNA6_BDEBC|nr:ATP-binding protein [Bdellovibrio bacteriovorus]KYG65779.1 hypothetical protein AZI86_01515 [Bdellovibrio bacteriovorus]